MFKKGKCLTFLYCEILTSIDLALASECRFRNLRKDGIVLPRDTGNVSSQGLQGRI
jgi:hypothetical protein